MKHQSYREGDLKHQEPIHAVSQWQELNDCDGHISALFENIEANYENADRQLSLLKEE